MSVHDFDRNAADGLLALKPHKADEPADAPFLAAGAVVARLVVGLDPIVFGAIRPVTRYPGARRLVHPGTVGVAGRPQPDCGHVTPLTDLRNGALPKPVRLAHCGAGARVM